jgi:glutamate dehydrogenase/leucine dehydrogenase
MIYTVTSDIFVPASLGSTVNENDLDGCNIDALVEAGHLVPNESSNSTTAKSATETKGDG